MKYLRVKNVNANTNCLVGTDHISVVVPPNDKNLNHCHLYFLNGERVIVAQSLSDMQIVLENLGHEVIRIEDCLKPVVKPQTQTKK